MVPANVCGAVHCARKHTGDRTSVTLNTLCTFIGRCGDVNDAEQRERESAWCACSERVEGSRIFIFRTLGLEWRGGGEKGSAG